MPSLRRASLPGSFNVPKQLHECPLRLPAHAPDLQRLRWHKGAVEQLSHVLAKELGPKGITVNVVSPGPTDTELFGEGKTEQDMQRFAQLAALGRLGQPQDIADVVALWSATTPDGSPDKISGSMAGSSEDGLCVARREEPRAPIRPSPWRQAGGLRRVTESRDAP